MNAFRVINPASIVFKVYQDFGSGATFVLPSNTQITSTASGCAATFSGTPITFRIEVRHYVPGNLNDALIQRSQFEANVMDQTPPGIWQIDYTWTSAPVFQPRFDDFAARRVSLFKSVPGFSPTESIFATSAIKRGTSLHIAAIAPSSYFLTNQMQVCTQTNNAPGCQTLLEQLQNWGKAVIAVHLATFPIG